MIVDHHDAVTSWRGFDGDDASAVRIWWRTTPWGGFQRHEWQRHDGTTWLEAWIPARTPPKALVPVGQPVDAGDVMAQALRAIAAGHNDARRVANDALDLVEDRPPPVFPAP